MTENPEIVQSLPHSVGDCVKSFLKEESKIRHFGNSVRDFFETAATSRVHSVRSRMKSIKSIKRKLRAKLKDGIDIRPDNLFEVITDFFGVRVLHLAPRDFKEIHQAIDQQVSSGGWILAE